MSGNGSVRTHSFSGAHGVLVLSSVAGKIYIKCFNDSTDPMTPEAFLYIGGWRISGIVVVGCHVRVVGCDMQDKDFFAQQCHEQHHPGGASESSRSQ